MFFLALERVWKFPRKPQNPVSFAPPYQNKGMKSMKYGQDLTIVGVDLKRQTMWSPSTSNRAWGTHEHIGSMYCSRLYGILITGAVCIGRSRSECWLKRVQACIRATLNEQNWKLPVPSP